MEGAPTRLLGLAPNTSILVCLPRCVKGSRRVAMPRLLGEKLRLLRRHQGMTQTALAHRLGLASHSHVTNLETGQDMASLDLVVRVAHVCHVTTDYLLRDTIPVEPVAPAVHDSGQDDTGLAPRLGRTLRMLRRERGWGQTELARQLGLARRGYISNLESGRKLPSIDLVMVIADLFGITTDDLLCPPDSAPTRRD
jgi:transcriptional regulator with XRE-family HTH domain